ncbi:VQ motif-containing protein 9 [Malania oleifera]|uniref:VQ motif-containing protein 9 n=1 Tax=Malania oleifera TaxID=397392 RepID=UPI0025AE6E70|nr:VQ motif-containing protein 9 [Malania oleifera]
MDKSCHSSGESTTTTASSSSSSNSNRDQYFKHLNKLSHKISKPIRRTPPPPPFDHTRRQPPPPPLPPQPPHPPQPPSQPQNLQQPPVYNINKSEFRDVVQKLTGSPAHERFSTPPPINPPKPQSSRLQRIRPPPLASVSNRPPPLPVAPPLPPSVAAAAAVNPNNPIINSHSAAPAAPGPNYAANFLRPVAPLSPLPPFPSVHGAAESPISAYMRYLQSSIPNADSDLKQFSRYSPLISPRWSNPTPPPPQPQQQPIPPPSPPPSSVSMAPSQFPMPSSPLPFGCLPSPKSPYPLLSPGLLFSPTAGQLGFPQFPLSPRLPVPSPRWKDL